VTPGDLILLIAMAVTVIMPIAASMGE